MSCGHWHHQNANQDSVAGFLNTEKHQLDLVMDTAFCRSLFFISTMGKIIRLNSTGAGREGFSEGAGDRA